MTESAEQETKPYLKIDAVGSNPSLQFNSPDETRNWVEQERQAWAPVVTQTSQGRYLTQILGSHNHLWQKVKELEIQRTTSLANAPKEVDANNRNYDLMIAQVISDEVRKNYILSNSPIGKFIIAQASSDATRQIAPYVLGLARSISPKAELSGGEQILVARAAAVLERFRSGEGSLNAEKAALDELYVKASEQLNLIKSENSSAMERLNTTIDSFNENLNKSRSELSSRLIEIGEELNALPVRSKNELDAVKKFYWAELATQAPVTYWDDKHRSHRTISICAFLFFLALLFAGPILLIVTFDWLQSKAGEGPETTYRLLLLVGVPSLGAFWLLRTVSRYLIQNISLMSDAAERVAMTKTFLALSKAGTEEGTGLLESERILVLQALFRPSNVTSNDDGTPLGLLEVLTRNTDRSRTGTS